ncbi:MAG: ABC transporter ATP-binding protein, partial [Clostridia bacterium]|nr:ABC transporter ATP-binding protein [Clostridia bacterium]
MDNTKINTNEPLLEMRSLRVKFPARKKLLSAVDGVNLTIHPGEIVGVVGESGSGKSVMSQSILRLRDYDSAVKYEGEILFEGQNLLDLDLAKMRDIRGNRIAVIFQDPLTSLSPVHTVGKQMSEVLRLHKGMSKAEALAKCHELLSLTGIPDPARCLKQYPYELSGGMQQRVMIAMALACEPALLIADEPTTALDVTIQAQILDLLRDLKNRIDGSIMLITHDLGIIAEMADYVVVMYAGRIIERGTVSEIFHNPMHPYTIGLQKSKPTMDSDSDTLFNIPGNVPNPVNMPSHCFFKERCSKCTAK